MGWHYGGEVTDNDFKQVQIWNSPLNLLWSSGDDTSSSRILEELKQTEGLVRGDQREVTIINTGSNDEPKDENKIRVFSGGAEMVNVA